jgi:glycosyltransferase involved in cell wall biosynthesis
MHVVETYFECGGFDHRFIQGGTSVYLWNLARSIAEQGHRVSIVTPAHGRLDDLRAIDGFTELDYVDSYELPLTLDRRTWSDFPEQVRIPLTTRAYRLTLSGVDLYFLSDELLDQLPDRFYPPYESKGSDLVFYKGVAYQVATVRFIRSQLLDQPTPLVVHAHEPYYHYLMPAAFADDPRVHVVGTVQSNMPITKSEYAPMVQGLLAFLDAPVELPPPDPAPAPDLVPMIQYQQRTHLHYAYPPDYVRIYDLVARYADRVSFLSPGHRRFYDTFAGTPFAQLFNHLPVATTVRETAAAQFVGGCAIGDDWLADDADAVDRDAVLTGLGLDPALPTFFHNARYAVHHKGQVELARAVGRALDEGVAANFVLRMVTDAGITDAPILDLPRRHPDRVYLETARVPDERIRDYASSSQFCLFPSKFEMDTFLIAMGEAMACGAVPIATAQEGMAHFGHVADPLMQRGTGFALPRSFAEDDPLLVDALVTAIHRAVRLYSDDPDSYARLSAAAITRAREFTWNRCAARHIAEFVDVLADRPARSEPPEAVDELTATPWFTVRDGTLRYRLPGVRRAELVLAGAPTDLRAPAIVHPLTPTDDELHVLLPDDVSWPLHLLLTMDSGATRWDVLHRD